MNTRSKYVFTNIYVDHLPLKYDEMAGLGQIALIIDPIILKYKKCYVNFGWSGNINEHTLIMNDVNLGFILNCLETNYKYPYILTHEALFKKKISIKFINCIVCDKHNEILVRNILDKFGYDIQIFNKFPTLKY